MNRGIFSFCAFLFLCLPTNASNESLWLTDWNQAVDIARAQNKHVLVDFYAPWCYSCYYMDKQVLANNGFAAATKDFVLLKVDVDQKEGAALKEKHRVSFLPTYLILTSDSRVAGRITGEQTEKDFLAQLSEIIKSSESDEEKAIKTLRARLAAAEYEAAEREIAGLEKTLNERLDQRLQWRILTDRLGLMAAARLGRPGGLEHLKRLLKTETSCDLAYDFYFGRKLLENEDPQTKRTVLKNAQQALERLVNRRFFAAAENRCADFRTGIETLADVYAQRGAKNKQAALLKRAVRQIQQDAPRVGADRNRDDNLRFFLELAGDDGKIRSFYAELIEAYPQDYVYPHRFSKYLVGSGQAQEALSWNERAAKLCYGANCLAVAGVKAKAMAALGRREEAVRLLQNAAQKNQRAFPKESAALAVVAKELSNK
ncbi:MAG: thioredoxin family protein [Elusimicrobia bacterium]|nr:thioredoxin family protein [Elusimicrobiota bacterium]